MNQTSIINFYGGPGTGKSTTAAHTFALLKQAGVNCEIVNEFAKDKVWEESLAVLNYQMYIFGKQLHRVNRLLGKVDYIVTDAPILMSLIYGPHEVPEFHALVRRVYRDMRNIDVFLRREKVFNPAGRVQNEKEAKELDAEIFKMVNTESGGCFYTTPANNASAPYVMDLLGIRV